MADEAPRKRLASTRKLIILSLWAVAVLVIFVTAYLITMDKEVPGELIAMGSAAVGGLLGLPKEQED